MRILKKIWWLPLLIYLVVMPSFISDKVYEESCKSIDVRISDSANYGFVTPGAVFAMVHNDNTMILGKPLDEVDLGDVESRIRKIRELESVEVYKTADGVLHIDADQRDPVVRIITLYGNSYYLDKKGEIIPHSSVYTARVPVVSGDITVPDNSISAGNIRSLPESSPIKKVLNLINTINEREFWTGQVEQLWVSGNGNIEIIPRIGNHVIKLGKPEGIERKLDYLEALYSESLPVLGWNRYKEINLMYERQIVCKKR